MDGMAYTSFLNGFKSRWFKFFLAEQKETTLAKALRKATDFICATKICAEAADAPKKAKVPIDGNPSRGDERPWLKCINSRFSTDP